MAATHVLPMVSVGEYLRSSYSPDREYVDGRVVERNVGEFEHSRLQTLLAGRLGACEIQGGVLILVEQRVQVTESRFRVPDVCILSGSPPKDGIVREAPLACIEILSPEDSFHGMEERVTDYLRMGVEHVWVVDPISRETFACSQSAWVRATEANLVVPGTSIVIPIAELLSRIPQRSA